MSYSAGNSSAVQLESTESLRDFLDYLSEEFSSCISFSHLEKDIWVELTYKDLKDQSYHLAQFLKSQNYQPGDKIAFISESRSEWLVFLFACSVLDLTLIPLDIRLELEEVRTLVEHSRPKLIVTSQQSYRNFKDLWGDLGQQYRMICLDGKGRDDGGPNWVRELDDLKNIKLIF